MYDHDILCIFTERLMLMDSWNGKASVASEVKRQLHSNKYLRGIFLLNCIKKFNLLLSSLIQKLYHNISWSSKLLWPLGSVFACILAFPGLIFYSCFLTWIHLDSFCYISERKDTTKFKNKKVE